MIVSYTQRGKDLVLTRCVRITMKEKEKGYMMMKEKKESGEKKERKKIHSPEIHRE